ncbi:long-chain-fatty-acid--CoA ligase [Myxococcota bacterium]|nr:long-chain-fatty-acid--CoA ligase [Myxococcota bacterium]
MLLHDYFDYWARVAPDREFGVDAVRRLSYGQAAREVEGIRAALIGQGVVAGERVAILARNRLEYPLFCFGASQAGAVPVTLNFRLAPGELRYALADSGARLLLAESEFVDAIDGERSHLPDLFCSVAIGGAEREGWLDYEHWWAGAAPFSSAERVAVEDDACQIYTSGTTGSPKGVVHSHQSIFASASYWRAVFPLAANERQLLVSPAFHSGGFLNFIHTALCGASVYLLDRFDPQEVLRLMEHEGIVRASLVPATVEACLDAAGEPQPGRYESLRYLSYGAAPISAQTMRRTVEVFGCEIHQQFGQTEAPILTHLLPEDHLRGLDQPELLKSTGRPVAGCELRIVDEDGNEVRAGEAGEIVARTPLLMKGYWGRKDETAQTVRGGWIHTGDVGRLDAEGYLYIVDRKKDMIVSGAENVYAREVEEGLLEHPAVAEVAVIGVPSERYGEEVKAVVVRASGEPVEAQELMDFCRDRMAGYKRPRSVDFVDALPRNANGKVLKRVLREPWWQGHDRRIS